MLSRLQIPCVLSKFRSYSTAPPNATVFISRSTSPYFNLTIEDWLFRKAPKQQPLLFLYINKPCVVIGRHQNPWKEINFPALRSLGIPFIRRRSGGGTVYHDLGNANYSIHLPRESFDRHKTSKVIQRALQSLHVNAEVNDRNDICVGGFKVSGSAYKIVNIRAYHHGTMLISTDLSKLGDALRNTKDTMVTRGVASVRSPVNNLWQFNPGLSYEGFENAMVETFNKEYYPDSTAAEVHEITESPEVLEIDYIAKGIEELKSWEWQYGQTPEFTHIMTGKFSWGELTFDISSKHGIINSCRVSSSDPGLTSFCKAFGESLVDQKYMFLEGLLGDPSDATLSERKREAVEWLRENM
ncbi:hypothetical protein M422DRAFT_773736 [Sphaerobolus stellatus SS14]|nr:hypothetical protein M422DRAFT_773736 [Sphaerobolus stellatus SS14]